MNNNVPYSIRLTCTCAQCAEHTQAVNRALSGKILGDLDLSGSTSIEQEQTEQRSSAPQAQPEIQNFPPLRTPEQVAEVDKQVQEAG